MSGLEVAFVGRDNEVIERRPATIGDDGLLVWEGDIPEGTFAVRVPPYQVERAPSLPPYRQTDLFNEPNRDGGGDWADTRPSVDDLLGADPGWTGGLSVDDYMDQQRRRDV